MMLTYQNCMSCDVRYLQAEFLAYRQKGYCTEECSYHERRGVPTAEDIGWKNGIPAASQRKRFPPLPPSNEPSRKWAVDMVHHPWPIGWQIENWRLVEANL